MVASVNNAIGNTSHFGNVLSGIAAGVTTRGRVTNVNKRKQKQK